MISRDKLKDPVTLFCGIEKAQHEKLREMAYQERRTLASVTRSALDFYFIQRAKTDPDCAAYVTEKAKEDRGFAAKVRAMAQENPKYRKYLPRK